MPTCQALVFTSRRLSKMPPTSTYLALLNASWQSASSRTRNALVRVWNYIYCFTRFTERRSDSAHVLYTVCFSSAY